MGLSRWITFPFVFGLLMVLPALLVWDDFRPFELLVKFVFGIIFGFVIQAWSDLRARQRAGASNIDDEIYKVRQTRSVTIFGDREKALGLCEQAVRDLGNVRVKHIDQNKCEIVARTKLTWENFGILIILRVVEIGDKLVEVTISTRPIPRTAAVDYGQGWEIAEKLTRFLRENDTKLNKNLLRDGAEILMAATKRPLGKASQQREVQSSE